jgi:hypothetical protein
VDLDVSKVVITTRTGGLAEAVRRGGDVATFNRSDDLRGARFVGVDLLTPGSSKPTSPAS